MSGLENGDAFIIHWLKFEMNLAWMFLSVVLQIILKVGEHELTCENRQGRGMDLDIRRDRRTI